MYEHMFFIILEAIHNIHKTFLINLMVGYKNTKCPELVELFVPITLLRSRDIEKI